jgi:hypothetical protein
MLIESKTTTACQPNIFRAILEGRCRFGGMKQDLALSSTLLRYVGLFLSVTFLLFFLLLYIITSGSWLILFILAIIPNLIMYWNLWDVRISNGNLIVKQAFKAPKIYPLSTVTGFERIFWIGTCRVTLDNGDSYCYIPTIGDGLAHLWDYGEYISNKVKSLEKVES